MRYTRTVLRDIAAAPLHHAARDACRKVEGPAAGLELFWTKGSTVHTYFPPLFEIRATPEGVIEGYAATFRGVDCYGDSVEPGAFSESLKRGRPPAMLWAHQHDKPIGRWIELREDARGLFVRGKLSLQTPAGRDAYAHLANDDVSGLSIGYVIPPGGATSRGDLRVLKQIDLAEISVVSIPADPGARVIAVKAQRPETLRELQHALQGLGYSRRQAAAICEKGFAGIGEAEEDPTVQLDALLGKLRAINF
jgi:HK97 family phage prohead protease